jgi:hypothetical protein
MVAYLGSSLIPKYKDMKTFRSIQTGISFFLMAAVLSCSNGGDNKEQTKETAKPAAETGNTAAAPATANKNGAVVSFTVNGVEANTLPSGPKDNDEPLGLWNVTNNYVSLTLMGDEAKFPHRGSLILSIDGFKPEPATYTMGKTCYASFSRYTTENAGGETRYTASVAEDYLSAAEKVEAAKRKCTINITKVEKVPSEFGEKYLASGTFSASMTLAFGYKNEISLIEIANGKFENVPVSVMGKK